MPTRWWRGLYDLLGKEAEARAAYERATLLAPGGGVAAAIS